MRSTFVRMSMSVSGAFAVMLLCLTGCAIHPRQTALHTTVAMGHVRATAQSLKDGAEPNVATFPQRITPLHVAVRNGNYQVAKLLIDRGADVNAADWERNTPLHLAVKGHFVNIARLLLDRGADVNAKMYDLPSLEARRSPGDKAVEGVTPLNYCATRGYKNMAALLRQHGADPKTGIW